MIPVLTLDNVLARLEAVRRCGAGFVARCPAHKDRAPSLSIREGEDGNVLLKCFAGCSYRAIIDALEIEPTRALRPQPVRLRPARCDDSERIAVARRIWREAREARGTIVQDYLFARGWTGVGRWQQDTRAHSSLDSRIRAYLAIPASIRFHPHLKHPSGVYLPAMVAVIETRYGAIGGVHRTFLKPDGTGKAEVEPNKLALGPLKGGSVHLTAGDREIVICEGIETGLAILLVTGLHVWAALGTSNLGQVVLPSFVRGVIIAADNDEPGLKAARAAADAYRARGLSVRIFAPGKVKADFNDVVREGLGNVGRK